MKLFNYYKQNLSLRKKINLNTVIIIVIVSDLEHLPVLGLPPPLLVVVHEALHAGPQIRVAPAQSEHPQRHDARVLGRHAAHPGVGPEATTLVTVCVSS